MYQNIFYFIIKSRCNEFGYNELTTYKWAFYNKGIYMPMHFVKTRGHCITTYTASIIFWQLRTISYSLYKLPIIRV